MYQISKESYHIAKKMNLVIKPSSVQNKKIDVYKNGVKLASIGDSRYMDYHLYKNKNGLDYANQRKKLYIIRHKKDISKIDSAGYFAYKLLWT